MQLIDYYQQWLLCGEFGFRQSSNDNDNDNNNYILANQWGCRFTHDSGQ